MIENQIISPRTKTSINFHTGIHGNPYGKHNPCNSLVFVDQILFQQIKLEVMVFFFKVNRFIVTAPDD